MSSNEDSSPPTFLPRDPGQTFDSMRGGHEANETLAKEYSDNTLPTFLFKPRADLREDGTPETGPYVVIKRVGRGGFGEVWEAVQTALNRRVAIKQLHIKAEDEDEARELDRMFRQEAFTTAALDHPNIVPVYDYGTDEAGRPVLAMKLVRGESWNGVIANDFRTLSPHELLAKNLPILVDVTQAVLFAHDAGVVHRDLKPSQVMLGAYGEVLLMDWGLAIRIGEPGEDANLTAFDFERIAPRACDASSPAGTPAFMAPEQTLSDGSLLGTWTDVYLLGGILYVLLTGTRPHEASNATAALELAQSVEVEDPRKRAPGRPMPDDLVELAMRALQKEPRDRIGSAREFLAALQEHISGASKRRESVAITDQVLARVQPMPTDYAALAECLNELDHARLLWPENEPARNCREELLTAQARIAIREGDLLLARVTTERLASAEARAALHKELNQVEAERRRRERERGALRLATTTLLLVMIAGGTWFVFKLNEERQQALTAKARADASRGRAEELLDFMIGDLRTQLQPIGRVGVLDSVGKQAELYLASLPKEEQGTKALLQRVKTTTQLARVRMDQGDLKHAEEMLAGLAPLIATGIAQSNSDHQWLAVRGHYNGVRGRVFFDQGRLKDSSQAHREAAADFKKLQLLSPSRSEWLRKKAENLRGSADSLNMIGDYAVCIPEYEEAIDAYRELLAGDPEDAYAAIELAKALTRMSIAMQSNGAPLTEFHSYLYESDELARKASEMKPDDLNLRSEHAITIGDNTHVLRQGGAQINPVQRAQMALDIMDGLVRADSANLDWKSTRLSMTAIVANALSEEGKIESACDIYRATSDELAALIETNPTNNPMKRDLINCANNLNILLEPQGLSAEIAKRSKVALDLCLEAAFGESRLSESRVPATKILKSLSKAATKLYVAGDIVVAGPYLETTIEYRRRIVSLDLSNKQLWGDYVGEASMLAGLYSAKKNVEGVSRITRDFNTLFAQAPQEIRQTQDLLIGRFVVGLMEGDVQMIAENFDAAEESYLPCIEHMQTLATVHPQEQRLAHTLLAQVSRRLGSIALERNDLAAAKELLERVRAHYEKAMTFPEYAEPSYKYGEDFALAALLAFEARIKIVEGGVRAGDEVNERLLEAIAKYNESRDPRMAGYRATALIYLGRQAEAEPLLDLIRETTGSLPRAIQVALDETKVSGDE